jgi:hypothetical protein
MDKVEIQKLKELDVNRLFDNLIDKEVTNLNLIDLIKHFTGFENIRLTALCHDILDYLVEHDKVVDACSYQFGTVFIKKHKFETIYKLWELTNKYLNNKPQQVTTKHPFETTKTLELFNYIAHNWEYKADIKWAYIYMFFDNPKIYKNIYERHIRKTKDFEGLFNYNNANSPKVYDELKELKETFNKNYL